MDTLITTLRFLHISTGFISLLLFWIPVIAPKGGKTHRLSGKAYAALMWIVVSTAALLSLKNAWIGDYQTAAFLGFISLITANSLWYAVAILKHKHEQQGRFAGLRLAFSATIVLSAAALVAYGIYLNGQGSAVLMFIFAGLGFTELPNLVNRLRAPHQRLPWLKEHIVGICSSGIAAYTAFFVFGGNQFFSAVLPGYWAIVPWVAPGLIGTIGIRYAVQRFTKGLEKKAR